MNALRRWWAGHEPKDRAVMLGLAGLLLAGTALRAAMVLAVRPALLGLPDSFWYVTGAQRDVFLDPLHPAGYPLFLRGAHALSSNLAVTIGIQHVLGLVAGILLFLVVRRLIGSTWWALLPAAVLSVGGSQVILEHAVASESVFVSLQAGAIYAAVRAFDTSRVAWAVAAGVLAGSSVVVRPAGLVTVVVLALWLLAVTSDRPLRRLAGAGAVAVPAIVIVAGYVVVQNDQTGDTGIPRASGWYVYGRAAPFADCDKFTPPAGTARLCEDASPSQRSGPTHYVFDPSSPAVRAFGNPLAKPRSLHPAPGRFGRAVLRGQVFDWLEYVATEDLPRYVRPGRILREDQGPGYQELVVLLADNRDRFTARAVAAYYTGSEHRSGSLLDALRSYERVTRMDTLASVLGLVLLTAGLVLPRGRQRIVVSLPALVALGGMLATAVTWGYDARYAIAYHGPAAAAAAIGGAMIWARVMARRRRAEPASTVGV